MHKLIGSSTDTSVTKNFPRDVAMKASILSSLLRVMNIALRKLMNDYVNSYEVRMWRSTGYSDKYDCVDSKNDCKAVKESRMNTSAVKILRGYESSVFDIVGVAKQHSVFDRMRETYRKYHMKGTKRLLNKRKMELEY